MKRTLLLLVLSIAIFPYCTKEVKSCWKCTTMTAVSEPGTTPTESSSNTTMCDKTENEINDYKKASTYVTKSGTKTYSHITSCSRQ